ncbi:siroheme decarboxylase subunit beta [Anaerosinus massiliensis]|uniref:siroheme decarboxylase subunit beta n=1 Tax=Massilibacillus massiliensis TaxID=1806837 RepID=UPI000A9F8EBA|nr:AsnC family transcriptional regulator [Massilibacillus massiliensis]
MDALDKKIIRVMQDEFPLVSEPYKVLADQIGITQDELIERLKKYKQAGQIRKMGAVLRHREVGYAANALCAWSVPEERLEEIATLMAENSAVSHCYDRNTAPEWPYNVYTMIHGHSREECEKIAGEITQQTNITEKVMLYSVKEWKKTSMRYFCE